MTSWLRVEQVQTPSHREKITENSVVSEIMRQIPQDHETTGLVWTECVVNTTFTSWQGTVHGFHGISITIAGLDCTGLAFEKTIRDGVVLKGLPRSCRQLYLFKSRSGYHASLARFA